MPDISAIGSALASIKAATEIAKIIKESDISLAKAETKLKLADLMSALADARIEIAQIQELIIEKDKIIANLREQQEIKSKLKFEAPYYFCFDGGSKDGPFCQCCYDKGNKLIRLIEQKCPHGTFHCMVCDSWYGKSHW